MADNDPDINISIPTGMWLAIWVLVAFAVIFIAALLHNVGGLG